MTERAEASGGVAKIVVRVFHYASSYDLRFAGELLAGKFFGKLPGDNPLTFQIDPGKIITVFE